VTIGIALIVMIEILIVVVEIFVWRFLPVCPVYQDFELFSD
jgi:hypothetical protein